MPACLPYNRKCLSAPTSSGLIRTFSPFPAWNTSSPKIGLCCGSANAAVDLREYLGGLGDLHIDARDGNEC